jgi:hypothetical protein
MESAYKKEKRRTQNKKKSIMVDRTKVTNDPQIPHCPDILLIDGSKFVSLMRHRFHRVFSFPEVNLNILGYHSRI